MSRPEQMRINDHALSRCLAATVARRTEALRRALEDPKWLCVVIRSHFR